MFEVIEAVPEEPIRIFAAPDNAFRPGLVGQFYNLEGNIVCGLSDGSKPIGIIDDFKIKTSWFDPTSLIRIWTQRMKFRTDEFDKDQPYRAGMALYVNKLGQFTSKVPDTQDSSYVARLLIPPSPDTQYFEALWL